RHLARARLGDDPRPRPAVPPAGRDAADLGQAGARPPAGHAHARRRHLRQFRRRAPTRRRVQRDFARHLGGGRARGAASPPTILPTPTPDPTASTARLRSRTGGGSWARAKLLFEDSRYGP